MGNTRYKVTKDQLERIVENFVMESSENNGKTPVKNMIPKQAPEAKKHVKNKMSGDMVDQSEGMPAVTSMKKKSQAPEAKKYVSNKMSGKMVEKSSNMPKTTGMVKKSQAPEAKKNMVKKK